ncbi:alpha/beta hydrolase [Chelatococcus reniformis]|uniref:Esterase n=1 Tax=Chelatococcus reniformis TaxID=1494448 RepID=A0A916XBW6_9HYPH|nr:alpha/beta hydrolase [Chelatococcus reniformis]GGC62187.1 esterase [Chelatococcus reniformis]
MKVYGQYTRDEIEMQYNLRAGRPDYDSAVVPDWVARSLLARERLESRLDVAYGPGPKQKLDVFPAGPTAPTLVYFHGGYWQRGDKSVYAFLAEPFVASGISVILVGYDLCPAVTITAISAQARQAMVWIWRNAATVGVARERLAVMGHSAGGHITGMLMGTDWTAWSGDIPADLIKAGVPISPLNELEPLRFTSINDAVGMDAAEAAHESPMHHPPRTDAPQLVVCGEAETAEFHRQSDIYVEAFATAARPVERYSVPGCDHFDELNVLARPASPFFGKCVALVRG